MEWGGRRRGNARQKEREKGTREKNIRQRNQELEVKRGIPENM